ncbi:MAG: hypothetical protein GTO14_14845 [Anaerolineales bacterium]|nr:hypothetical protein [Anaerolineales bacterium]
MEYEYGSEIWFTAEITASVPIKGASLSIRTHGTTSEKLDSDLTAGNPNIARVVLDMRSSPLPPFSTVEYWWNIDFGTGEVQEPIVNTFLYADNRLPWRTIKDSPLILHWVLGNDAFGRTVLEVAHQSLDDIRTTLGLPEPPEFHIYVYPSHTHLQATLALGGRSWLPVHTRANLGVVALAIPDADEHNLYLKHDLPHEITHVMLHTRLRSQYDDLPIWFIEGLATTHEAELRPEHRLALEDASQNGVFLPMQSLCAAFPAGREETRLAYAQSASFVEFLKESYGLGEIANLITAYQEGAGCTEGVQNAFHRSIDQLETEWKRTVFGQPTDLLSLRPILSWLLMTLPLVTFLLLSTLTGGRESNSEDSEASTG